VKRRAVGIVVEFLGGVSVDALVAPGFAVENDRDKDIPISPEQLTAARGTYQRFIIY
jgi:hypothetical protein